jgi:hypothetical protein
MKTLDTVFRGTQNPRHLRAIAALLRRPMPREHLDKEVGCSNAPDLVSQLRDKGLEIPCNKVADVDRDGNEIKRGVYYLSALDRKKVNKWHDSRKKTKVA